MIVPYHSKYLDTLMAIWIETNIAAHPFIPKAYWEQHYDMVQAMLPQAALLLCVEDCSLKGFIGVTDGCYIAGLFVGLQWQSAGVGQALIASAKEQYPQLKLHVYQKNIRAIRFYQKAGFHIKECTVQEDTGEPEYLMIWPGEVCQQQ